MTMRAESNFRLSCYRSPVSMSVTLGTGSMKGAVSSPRSHGSSVARRKCGRRPPLRMTPKAQSRRWFEQHARRMRARALRTAREEADD
jgi:hypothetical protein